MERWILGLGAASAAIAVLLGAFGAHGLRARLASDLLAIFETGVRYQMYHALALVAVGLWAMRAPASLLGTAAILFAAGTFLFSGSLYALALTGTRALGAITPFGGVAFIAGWVCLLLAAVRR